MKTILAVESSCDETAAAIVRDGTKLIAASLATSSDIHVKTGGVIPEVAARKQLEFIVPVIENCFKKSGLDKGEIDAVAVTVGPGLIGSLVVGVESAKTLALAWNKPLIPVNHLVGHIYANFIGKDPSEIPFPALVLVVSGGHTDLVLMKGHGNFQYLGGTLDDAAGEAFDKAARVLGLAPYMGGPAISRAAKNFTGKKSSFTFRRPMIDSHDFNFSFSGIKTAVMNKAVVLKDGKVSAEEVAYEFQEAVTDVLVSKTIKAAAECGVMSILLAGGVSANEVLREKLKTASAKIKIPLFVPAIELCTDNAVSIASAAFYNYAPRGFSKVKADPGLSVMDKV